MSATSARGLFRAMGKTAKPVLDLIDGEIAETEARAREKDDFYPTPPEPTRAFLHAEQRRLRDFATIWEPAAGDGAMAREMETVGLNVFRSDLVDRGCDAVIRDFYDFTPHDRLCRAIVTNPPFQECNWRDGRARWIYHALEVLEIEYMALLLPWSWPGAAGMATLWEKYPPACAYLMRWKIDFTGQGSPPTNHGWFVWDKAWVGETAIRMLDRKDARQSELFGGGHDE
ncbi:hypothetical protein [Martelella sp. HB161492]|uniref:hypothetical protein n=1 Tax=Martelella sp. HB161492 TaxID=2720726 RepID=UPI0015905832|nr:hypothetical protein [Martelella sp. HB161492]